VGVWVMTTMTTTSESLTDTREMFAAHSLFRREFGLSPGLVRAVTAGGMARAALVTRHLDLLVTVLTVHHAAEDEHLWPRLLACGTQEIRAIARVMEEQHKAIHEGLVHVTAAAESWRASASAHARDRPRRHRRSAAPPHRRTPDGRGDRGAPRDLQIHHPGPMGRDVTRGDRPRSAERS